MANRERPRLNAAGRPHTIDVLPRRGSSVESEAVFKGARVSEAPLGAPGARRVRDLPADERPRERLARHGVGALSNRELLALLVGTGSRRSSALGVAEGLLGAGLHDLAARGFADLTRVHGLGRAKASRVLAALELGARVASEGCTEAPVFRAPEDAGRYLLPRYGSRPVETFGLLALDVRRRLKREAVVSVGCLTSSLVHPREVFQEAVLARAAALVLFHNHPSGDPEPSAEDLALTRRLTQAGQLMGIEVVDHLVLGAGQFVSLKQRGIV
jgi:DNA repair protein RadC